MEVLGTVFILFGILMLFRPVIEAVIKFNNSLRGIKTHISTTTIIFYRASAVIWIVFILIFFF